MAKRLSPCTSRSLATHPRQLVILEFPIVSMEHSSRDRQQSLQIIEEVSVFKKLGPSLALILLSGCVQQSQIPETPQFLAAKDAEMLRITQERCSGSLGGFSDAKDLQTALVNATQRAKNAGATASDFANARKLWEGRFTAGEVINGPAVTCAQMVSGAGSLAATNS